MNTTTEITTHERRGCPLDYAWCLDVPIVQLYQLIIGYFFVVFGYTIANVMSFTIYSKLLGPWPQVHIQIYIFLIVISNRLEILKGTMMGILTGVGSSARASGPIVVSYLYGAYGPRISFIFLIVIITAALVLISATYKRYKEYSSKGSNVSIN